MLNYSILYFSNIFISLLKQFINGLLCIFNLLGILCIFFFSSASFRTYFIYHLSHCHFNLFTRSAVSVTPLIHFIHFLSLFAIPSIQRSKAIRVHQTLCNIYKVLHSYIRTTPIKTYSDKGAFFI